MTRNNEIEVLRALGIIFVIMSHLNLFITWSPAWIVNLYAHAYFWGGVDLFFCVSGFVITKNIIKLTEIEGKKEFWSEALSFWIRRFYRLVPVAWFFLILKILISIFFSNAYFIGTPSANIIDFVAQVFHLSNFRYYYCNIGFSTCGTNPIYWSLSLEEQFYILLPIAIYFLRNKLHYLLIALILIQFPIDRQLFSFGWLIRTDTIAWGCLIAIFSNSSFYKLIAPVFLKSWLPRAICIIMSLVALAVFARGEVVPFGIGIMAIPCAIMVFASSYNEGFAFKYLRNNFVMMWIASRSYSIYLSHVICFAIVHNYLVYAHGSVNGADTFKILFFGTLLTIATSEFSYKVIESPLRRKGKEISKARLIQN